MQRRIWKKEEDSLLRKLLSKEEGKIDWELIQTQMKEKGFDFSIQQIRTR